MPARLPSRRPHAKLADFGIAYLLDASRITSPGLMIGTAAYLAPEQLRGAEPAAAADIFSLGLVLLEALTGQCANSGGDGLAGALERVKRPPTIPASVDRRWARLLARMLDPEPRRRPTAAEVAMAAGVLAARGEPMLASATATPMAVTAATVPLTVSDSPVTAVDDELTRTLLLPAAVSDPTTAPSQARRRRLLMAGVGGAAAAALIAGAAVLGVSLMEGQGQAPAPAATVPGTSDPSAPSAPTESDDSGDGETVVDQNGQSDEARKAAEEAAKKAAEEQKKLEEEQQKLAEEEQKKAEDELRKQQEGAENSGGE